MKRLLASVAVLVFCTSIALSSETKSVKALIVSGDHGHAWQDTTVFLKDLLTKAGFQADVTTKPRLDLTAENLAKYNVLLFNYKDTARGAAANPDSVWTDENKHAFKQAIHNGTGLVVYHHASSAFTDGSEFSKEFELLSAGGWRKQGGHGQMHEFTVSTQKEHAITRGIKKFQHGRDELYQNSLTTPGSEILVTAYSEKSKDPKNTGKEEPMVWTNSYGKGRVVQNALGHDVVAMQSAGFKTLMIRCVEWAATGNVTAPVPDELKAE